MVNARMPMGSASSSGNPGSAAVRIASGESLRHSSRFSVELVGTLDFDDIFSIIKASVKKELGMERSGIGLALADLPNSLGAFWEVGGNYLVLNENLLNGFLVSGRPRVEYNSFILVILMHEYLHSLGFIDEGEARRATLFVCSRLFSSEHPAYRLAASDPWELYPFLIGLPRSGKKGMTFVREFDLSSTPYIS